MDEQHLIQQIKQGDINSFRHLYRIHVSSAWQMAMTVCKNNTLAEEAVQTSFINAFHYIHQFQQQSSFKTWLLRIVLNECVRILKLEKKFLWQEINDANNEEIKLSVPPSEYLNSKELKMKISMILQKLNEKEASVLSLFYLEEMSIKEIAQILSYTESNVKVLLHRARKNFKYEYEKS
ncbi:MAG TPA: RNA polymerase sigma factor [Chitinophagaceae bacterium]|nr:MAG: ECF subfamily RNA polymerase sigma-24 subunit [Bacteroidetes bacterium OLB11]HMN33023.1 RNA polymerase sigma factor [Chitinophagaceae bacterium]